MFKENAIYRYWDKFGEWCTHGIVYTKVINGELWALDTYSDAKFVNTYPEEYQKRYKCSDLNENDLEYVMMIDEVEEVDAKVFSLYGEADKLYIPTGNWKERYYINKNKTKNEEIVRECLVEEERYFNRQIENAKQELERIKEYKSYIDKNTDYIQLYDGKETCFRALYKIKDIESMNVN